MVKTRTDVKIKIAEFIESNNRSFSTQEVKEYLMPLSSNINLSSNRLTKFIRSTGKAEFDKSKRIWNVRLKPFENIK